MNSGNFTAIPVEIPLGKHELIMNNTGNGLFVISTYTFTNYRNPLRGYALQGTGRMLGWVKKNFFYCYFKIIIFRYNLLLIVGFY